MEFQKAWLLLDIIHKAASAGPAYSWLGDMAAAELGRYKPIPQTPVVPTASLTPAPVPNESPSVDGSSVSPTSDDDIQENLNV